VPHTNSSQPWGIEPNPGAVCGSSRWFLAIINALVQTPFPDYDGGVKSSGLSCTSCKLLAVVLLLCHFTAAADPRQIRLRNETILTGDATNSASGAQSRPTRSAASPAASGLFLIQFTDHLQPAWQAELRSLGVDLLRYVPDDAFIAKLDNVSPDQISALSFVNWVGPYLPEHKIHSGLLTAARSAAQTNATVTVPVNI